MVATGTEPTKQTKMEIKPVNSRTCRSLVQGAIRNNLVQLLLVNSQILTLMPRRVTEQRKPSE